jgi:hypothetical protein
MHQVYRIVLHENQCFSNIFEDLELPENKVDFYTNCLRNSKYLLIIKSTESQVTQAQSVFSYLGLNDWEIYDTVNANHFNSSKFDEVPLSQNVDCSMILSYS